VRIAAALAASVVIATACGGGAAVSTPTPIRTVPTVTRTATPTPVCPGAPNQPSAKATVTLEKGGTFVIQLRPDVAQKTVSIFALKAQTGFYNGKTFHRVEDWVVQGGDPLGDGTGGGQQCTELSDLPFIRTAVGIARRPTPVEISNDSQFFILKKDNRSLDHLYTNFGTVISGMDVVDKIAIGDKIKTITVE
jgi:peptidyl-prolyl cis-trans isomerase B (cyclophilin B)